jgi:hypothetical protein
MISTPQEITLSRKMNYPTYSNLIKKQDEPEELCDYEIPPIQELNPIPPMLPATEQHSTSTKVSFIQATQSSLNYATKKYQVEQMHNHASTDNMLLTSLSVEHTHSDSIALVIT